MPKGRPKSFERESHKERFNRKLKGIGKITNKVHNETTPQRLNYDLYKSIRDEGNTHDETKKIIADKYGLGGEKRFTSFEKKYDGPSSEDSRKVMTLPKNDIIPEGIRGYTSQLKNVIKFETSRTKYIDDGGNLMKLGVR